MPNNSQKQAAYNFCKSFIEDRLARIHNNISSIQESLSSETKSSAGDKHETGRAMFQLEREKLGVQLSEAETMRQLLSKVNIGAKSDKVRLGSLVRTSKETYFISISAGDFKTSEKSIFCISVRTPIGQLLLGKSTGDHVVFNKNKIQILEII